MHVEIQNRYLQKSVLVFSWHLNTIKVPGPPLLTSYSPTSQAAPTARCQVCRVPGQTTLGPETPPPAYSPRANPDNRPLPALDNQQGIDTENGNSPATEAVHLYYVGGEMSRSKESTLATLCQ